MALAGELVGVGGHFLFLGLALVSKDWRFLQRMITAPCILFLFYGSVSPFTCGLLLPIFISSVVPKSPPTAQFLRGGRVPSLGTEKEGFTVYSTACP